MSKLSEKFFKLFYESNNVIDMEELIKDIEKLESTLNERDKQILEMRNCGNCHYCRGMNEFLTVGRHIKCEECKYMSNWQLKQD